MNTDARPIALAFGGIFFGAAAFLVALCAGDSAATLDAVAMSAYCGAEFLRVAAVDVR